METEIEQLITPVDDHRHSYICDYCNLSFILKCNLVSHIRAHIGEKPYKCDICGESYSSKSGLGLHFRTHKNVAKKFKKRTSNDSRFICNYCDKGFTLKSNLILHIRTHTGERPYRCSYCNKTSATKYNLISHIRTHYSQKTIKCGYCDKYFSSRKNLHSHVQIHISNKRYYCSYCDKSSIHKGTLRVHERIHTGEKPYKCLYCGKLFNHRSNLTHHVRIHTGERPFVCKYCNKSFRQKYALDGHERIHTGARPYVCVDCNKTFPYSASLRSHMKIHLGDQVFTCYYCMRSFTSKVSLSLHIRVHLWNKNNPPKQRVNKSDEILLKDALAAQPLVKKIVKEDPLTSTDDNDKLQQTDYDSSKVDSVVNMLLTPELESGIVHDLTDDSPDLKNRLREQLCKFINKYSLKNIPKKPGFQVGSPKPKPKTAPNYYTMMPSLKTKTQAEQSLSAMVDPLTVNVSANGTSQRENVIGEIDKLQLKDRISTQLKSIVNNGLIKKDRKPDPYRCRSVVVQLPTRNENRGDDQLKSHMNNQLQKLFQTNLVKRFDALTHQKVDQKNPIEKVSVKVKDEKIFHMETNSDESSVHFVDCMVENGECHETMQHSQNNESATEPITKVHIKMEIEDGEKDVVIC